MDEEILQIGTLNPGDLDLGPNITFDDTPFRNKHGKITAVRLRAGYWSDAVQFRFGDVWGIQRGGDGGSLIEINLNPGER